MQEFTNQIIENAKEKNGKLYIDCAKLMSLAQQYKVPLSEAGKLCNEKKIKIQNCQLGCF